MISKSRAKKFLFCTLFIYLIFITGFTFGVSESEHPHNISQNIQGKQRGIDPTPMPPEPPPNIVDDSSNGKEAE